MAQASRQETLKALRDLSARRGYHFPEFEWLAEQDPEFEMARVQYSELIFARKDPALPVKYRELIEAVVLSFRRYPTLDRHVRRAIREGATMQECVEAFEVATVPGGMPVLHYALPFLIEIDKDMKAGKPV